MISPWRALNRLGKRLLPERLKARLRGRYYGYRAARVAIPHAIVASGDGWRVSIEGLVELAVDSCAAGHFRFQLSDNGEAVEEFHGFLRHAAARDGVLLDVGANCGTFSLAFCAARAGNRAIAVEPETALLEALRRNVTRSALTGRIEPVAAFLGDAEGSITGAADANHHFTPGHAPGGYRIRRLTVDRLLRERGVPITALKIDVDGGEIEVLRGAAGTLHEQRPTVFLELHHGILERAGRRPADAVALLREAGYTFTSPLGAALSARAVIDPRAALIRVVGHPPG